MVERNSRYVLDSLTTHSRPRKKVDGARRKEGKVIMMKQ